jgi:hypothetical protein
MFYIFAGCLHFTVNFTSSKQRGIAPYHSSCGKADSTGQDEPESTLTGITDTNDEPIRARLK